MRRRIIQRRRKNARDFRERFKIGAGAGHGASAAQKLDAQIAADAIQLAQQDRTNFARRPNVRTAASAAVQVLDGNDANLALAFGRFAQPQVLGGMLEADGHRPILKDDLIGAALGLAKLLRFQRAGRRRWCTIPRPDEN